MIHYINSILLCITFFLLLKTYKIHEGYINIGSGRIPNVPNDVACMVLHGIGVDIDRMQYLKNKCTSPENKQKKDENSNICRA